MRRKHHAIEDLRRAIDCLPVDTRVAMLQGVRSNDIIVGAYTDRKGGVCPMLAAHRCGGRTSLATFAKAWDRYTKAGPRARPASDRELRTLTAMLEASLTEDGYLNASLSETVASVKAARRADAERAARGASQSWLSQLVRRGRTVEEAAEAVENELEKV